MPELTESTIRIRGVYIPKGSDGTGPLLELRVPRLEDVVVIGWLGTDPRFKLPVAPIESLASLSRQTLVRVAGRVKGQEVGQSLRIRDATGQVELITDQDRVLAIDEEVEAIGYPAIEGTAWKLERALFRSLTSPLPLVRVSKNATLRVAAQVLELPREEATAGRSVLISGVVSWSDPSGEFMFVQDTSGGVRVERGVLTEPLQTPGRIAEIRGRTSFGSFAPVVIADEIVNLGAIAMPEARQVSLESAQTGVEEA